MANFPTEDPYTPARSGTAEGWRQTHLGRLMGHALRRFDARVLALMANDVAVPLRAGVYGSSVGKFAMAK